MPRGTIPPHRRGHRIRIHLRYRCSNIMKTPRNRRCMRNNQRNPQRRPNLRTQGPRYQVITPTITHLSIRRNHANARKRSRRQQKREEIKQQAVPPPDLRHRAMEVHKVSNAYQVHKRRHVHTEKPVKCVLSSGQFVRKLPIRTAQVEIPSAVARRRQNRWIPVDVVVQGPSLKRRTMNAH